MKDNRGIHLFLAIQVVAIAGMTRLFGIFDMELTEVLMFFVRPMVLLLSFIGSCWLFGKMKRHLVKIHLLELFNAG